MVSAAKRGIEVGARISNTEMVKAALQTMSITKGSPYAYNKWLANKFQCWETKQKECVDYGVGMLKECNSRRYNKKCKIIKSFIKG